MISTNQSAVTVALACIVGALLFLSSCGVKGYSASTSGAYKVVNADGSTIDATYESNKDQQGFHVEKKADGSIIINVDEASTSKAAIAAAAAQGQAIIEAIMKAFDMGMAAGKAGS